MAWNSKIELVRAAKKIAEKKHPDGYNKKQLIEANKEVNGGFSTTPYKTVKTHEDINNLANHMAFIDGHYPAGMSSCEVVGINGDCGLRCPVFLDGDCKELGEWTREDILASDELDDHEKNSVIEAYF